MSVTRTRDIEVHTRPEYLEAQSDPEDGSYVFAYHIRIRNLGKQTVQLISRHWVITDGSGEQEEVRGDGVIGQQPTLRPGDVYQYTSYCPLPSPVGTMHGSFQMMDESGEAFDARIDPFRLALRDALN